MRKQRKNPVTLSIDNMRRWAYIYMPRLNGNYFNQATKYFKIDDGTPGYYRNIQFLNITLSKFHYIYHYIFKYNIVPISPIEQKRLWKYYMSDTEKALFIYNKIIKENIASVVWYYDKL